MKPVNTSSNNITQRAQLQLAVSDQIGLIRKRCTDQGIVSVSEIADACEALRQKQVAAGLWCYENYTESGSHSEGMVKSAASSASRHSVIWPINHYLGLNRHPEVIQAAIQALQQYGTGCGTSAMSGGHNQLHKDLERRLADILRKEAAILFPTGYSANLGAISGLAKGGDCFVLFDRECHASIIDGIRLSGCKYLPFRHNDMADLEEKLQNHSQSYANVFVIVESVYSMTGEEAPLREIVQLKQRYPFYFFVDEAHAFGLYDVGGLCRKLGISDEVDFVMTTLSKSTASIGGVVATSRAFKSLLQVHANAYLFQAALTPPDAAAVLAALDVIEKSPELVQSLWDKTAYLRQAFAQHGFDTGKGVSPIVPVYIRDSATLLQMGREMFEHGIYTTSVAYPVVKHSEVRFRFIVNASHTYEQMDQTVSVMAELGKKFGVI